MADWVQYSKTSRVNSSIRPEETSPSLSFPWQSDGTRGPNESYGARPSIDLYEPRECRNYLKWPYHAFLRSNHLPSRKTSIAQSVLEAQAHTKGQISTVSDAYLFSYFSVKGFLCLEIQEPEGSASLARIKGLPFVTIDSGGKAVFLFPWWFQFTDFTSLHPPLRPFHDPTQSIGGEARDATNPGMKQHESVGDAIERIVSEEIESIEEITDALVVEWDGLEHWQRDNDFILTGHRKQSNSFPRSFASVLELHNESVNIWTHLLGAVVCISLLGALLAKAITGRYETATSADAFAFLAFFLGGTCCFSGSWIYHTVSNHSDEVHALFNKIDYVGIILLISGSIGPSLFYGLYCHPHLFQAYVTMIAVFSSSLFMVIVLERFRTPEWRSTRSLMFVLLGLSSIVPVFHGLLNFGYDKVVVEMSLWYVVSQGVLYIAGAIIYAKRFPERRYPRTFDLFGSSHQIFHVLVLVAASVHFVGLLKAFDHRHGQLGGSCPLPPH